MITTHNVKALIDDLANRYRKVFATTCKCGQAGCPGAYVPEPHDLRVVAFTLASSCAVALDLFSAGRSDDLHALLETMDEYGSSMIGRLDDADVGLEHTEIQSLVQRFLDPDGINGAAAELAETDHEIRIGEFAEIAELGPSVEVSEAGDPLRDA